MTMDVYAHLFDELSAPAMKSLGEIMAPAKLTAANEARRTTEGYALLPRPGEGR
jgi:hypothetical protein